MDGIKNGNSLLGAEESGKVKAVNALRVLIKQRQKDILHIAMACQYCRDQICHNNERIMECTPLIQINMMHTYQHVQVLPEVLRHESEKSKKRPAEAVKAGVAVVWIAPSLHTCVAFRTTTNQKHT